MGASNDLFETWVSERGGGWCVLDISVLPKIVNICSDA